MSFEHHLKCRCTALSSGASSHSGTSQFFLTEAKPHYAPDRLVDIQHIKIEVSVDLKQKMLRGTCTTDFLTTASVVEKLVFDAVDLKVEQVFDETGAELRFDQSDIAVTVFMRKALQAGVAGTVVMKYWVQEPRAGLYFIAPTKDEPTKPLQLWTQGQDEDNRYWFPCHDAPNEKATTEMVVTVDEQYTAISNGKLISKTHDTIAKRTTFHWKQAIAHSSYLVTLCVGEFVELKDQWKNSRGEEIPVLYYTVAGREKETRQSFEKTPKMMEYFSKSTGVDYPYEKYSQVVAWDFIYGGMENTSATTQTEYTLHPESLELDYSSEPLVAHELAHQWFGDLLTCKEWKHAWLNEGFATYFEALWMGHEHGQDELLYEIYQNEVLYKTEDSGSYRRPIVTNIYLSPSDIFDRHLYEKAGRVLHMLHKMVGDEQWWKAIHHYLTNNHSKTVETVDLQRSFESVTGLALGWFFDQWLYKAGHPEIKAVYSWVEDKRQVKMTITQKQKTSDLTPLFRFPLQLRFALPGGDITHKVEVTEAEHTFWFPASEKPRFVSINGNNTILASWEFEFGREALIAQLSQDQDIMGRIAAAKALSKDHSRQSVEALGTALLAEKFWGVQAEIAQALGVVGSPKAQDYLIMALPHLVHPRARKAAVQSIGGYRNERSAEIGERLLREDISPLVQQAAGIALGQSRMAGVFEKLSAALGKRESWHDYYDAGILLGLAELKTDDRVLTLLLRHTKPGHSMFIRRAAVDALAKFGAPRPQLVVEYVSELTRDSNFFVRLYAIHALVALGHDHGVGPLKRLVDTVVEPRTYRAALVAMKSLREGKGPSEDVEKLRADFDRLRAQYSELLGRLETISIK